jgi:hypothetical protein
MNSKTLIAAFVAIVIFFFGGWLVWGILLESYYTSQTNPDLVALYRETPMMIGFVINSIAWAVLLVYLLHGMGGKSLGKGFTLVSAAINFSWYAMADVYDGIGVLLVDIVVGAVFYGIVGAITGWILGMGAQTTAEPVAG